jgi:hypothetical protein
MTDAGDGEHDWDWIAWDMHPRAGPRLISDWKYTPTAGFGILVKDALAGKKPATEPAALFCLAQRRKGIAVAYLRLARDLKQMQ